MNRFSVIVPLQGDNIDFEDTLASVLRHRPNRTQVIVVHDGSYTDPHRLSGEVELISVDGRPHLIRFFNQGVQAADALFVALIRPGVQIDENWQIAVDEAFEDLQIGCISPIIVNANRPTKIVAAGVQRDRFNNRVLSAVKTRIAPKNLARLSPLGPSSWLAVYRRDLLRAIGSLDERLDPHYLDLEIALALNQLGFKCALIPELIGEIESDLPIYREAAVPHGYSAQRAFRRYRSDWLSRWLAYPAELVRAATQPAWLEHMFQRVAANRMAVDDRHFADRLAELKIGKPWNQTDSPVEAISDVTKRAA